MEQQKQLIKLINQKKVKGKKRRKMIVKSNDDIIFI
jgi:hypothetical protein